MAWESPDEEGKGIWARRFDSNGIGSQEGGRCVDLVFLPPIEVCVAGFDGGFPDAPTALPHVVAQLTAVGELRSAPMTLTK